MNRYTTALLISLAASSVMPAMAEDNALTRIVEKTQEHRVGELQGGVTVFEANTDDGTHVIYQLPSGYIIFEGNVYSPEGGETTKSRELVTAYTATDQRQMNQKESVSQSHDNDLEAAPGKPAQDQDFIEGIEETAEFVTEGDGDLIAYSFYDPECPACQAKSRYLEANPVTNVEWRWIPVGFRGEAAIDAAAQLLDGDVESVQQNMLLMRDSEATGTPTTVYEHPDSGTVHVIRGYAPDAFESLEALGR